MTDRQAALGFSLISGIGPVTLLRLKKYFSSFSDAYNAPESQLRDAGLLEKYIQLLKEYRSKIFIDEYEELLSRKKVWYLSQSEPEYPDGFFALTDPPICIFGKGDKNILSKIPKVGIVGTRKMSTYGRIVTEKFAMNLGMSGCCIISGLAIGVDVTAHEASLATSGRTIAVLGNGVDICFPRMNEKIYQSILEHEGAIISEYPLGTVPSKGSFPARNRLIAALSDCLLVTEGQKKSGSLITAEKALSLHKKVFAVPGQVTSSLSEGPFFLLTQGAILALSPDDILKNLGKLPVDQEQKIVSADEKEVITLLSQEAFSTDELIHRLKKSYSDISILLSEMEMKGLIVKNPHGKFTIKNA